MKTISSISNAILDHKAGMKEAAEILKELDPQFSEIEQNYQEAAEMLKAAIGNSAEEYLYIKERSAYHEFLSLCWSGFLLNYSCFINPANALILNEDFDFFLQEHRLAALPEAKRASGFEETFVKSLPDSKLELLDPITDYFSYLQTVGYKLAHYWGYRLADSLLMYLVPGYVADDMITNKYRQGIRRYLSIKIEALEHSSSIYSCSASPEK